MLSAEPRAFVETAPAAFHLPPELEAREPAEARGAGRSDVRLLVSGKRNVHALFDQLPQFLAPGDVIVLNTSATIPAALQAQRGDGAQILLHFSTQLSEDLCIVEPRDAPMESGERLSLPGEGTAELVAAYRNSRRLWYAKLHLPLPFLDYLARYGRPIRYRHVTREWPLEVYQNVYAREAGSAEMASAGRPFTSALFEQLQNRGVSIASVVLHAGVASIEWHEPPHEEAFEVSAEAAFAIRCAQRLGGRVIAVGTTVVRALESSLDQRGHVTPSRGWTDLVITPNRRLKSVDGVLTGFHEPNSSHLSMLEAIAGPDRVRQAYKTALEDGYLWHEFGDSHLIFG